MKSLSITALAFAMLAAMACSKGEETTTGAAGSGGDGGMLAGGAGNGGEAASGGAGGGGGAGGAGGTTDACPIAIDLEVTAAASFFDSGYTGAGHGTPRDGGISYRLELYDCDEDCRRCKLRGPIDSPNPGGSSKKRCFNDMRQSCTADSDCVLHGGAANLQICRYPSFHQNNQQSGFNTCLFAIFDGGATGAPIEGVFDLATGDLTIDHNTAVVGVTLGQFCQDCTGDTTPNDGVLDGTCSRNNAPCDVNVQSSQAGLDYALSYDCMIDTYGDPTTLQYAFITISNERKNVTSTANELSLTAESPNCGAVGFETEKCFCGVCESTTAPCATAADCAVGVACVAGAYNTKPNGCVDVCAFNVVAGTHQCTNASAATIGCYPTLEPVPIPGSNQNMGDFYSVVIGDTSCIGPTGTGADTALGFPGMLRNVEALRITKVLPP